MSYFVYWCGHSRDSNGYYYVTASWVPYHVHTTCCDHSPCAELGFSTPHNTIQLDNHHGDRQLDNHHDDRQEKKKKRYPACLVHAVIRMFYSVVTNQRQPQYTCYILQRRCQPRSTIIRIFLRGAGGGAGGGVPICCLPSSFDHSLTTHPFRDGAPFISTPNSLIGTPPTFRRSLRFFHILHRNCFRRGGVRRTVSSPCGRTR